MLLVRFVGCCLCCKMWDRRGTGPQKKKNTALSPLCGSEKFAKHCPNVHLSRACYMPRPSHPPWFHHPNNIFRSVQVMQVLIMQSSSFLDLDCMADILMGFHRSTFSKPNTEFNSDLAPCDLWAFSTMERELRGKKFRSDRRSAAHFRKVGGAL
jgi:hypothetical protein